jgi:hypothetical protein
MFNTLSLVSPPCASTFNSSKGRNGPPPRLRQRSPPLGLPLKVQESQNYATAWEFWSIFEGIDSLLSGAE